VDLNIKQNEAVTAPIQPIAVIAGAGSGKTRVLIERIIYLIEHYNMSNDRILCLTFTNKAAKEMSERIIRRGYDKIKWMSTYHSLGIRILKQDITCLGRQMDFTTLDDEDQTTIIRNIMEDMNVKTLVKPKQILNIISNEKLDGVIDLSTVSNIRWDSKYRIWNPEDKRMIIEVAKCYENIKQTQNFIDYDDMIIMPLEIFRKHPEIEQKWKDKFDYILVDEFQDTNKQQYELLMHLCNKDNIFVVGDGDQTIYTWRGAYPMIFEQLIRDIPNVRQIILDINYRSSQSILNVSNKLIANNRKRIEKNLVAYDKRMGEKVKYFIADDKEEEANYITKKIMSLGKDYSKIAVIYRTNNLSRAIETEFINHGIPYRIFGGIKFYGRKEIKDLIAYLKLLVKTNDEVSLQRIINIPGRGIGQVTIGKIRQSAIENNTSFYDELKKSENEKIISFIKSLDYIKEQTLNLKPSEAIQKIYQLLNYGEYLKTIDGTWEDREQNILELVTSAQKMEADDPELTIKDYLLDIALYTSSLDKENIEDKNVVTLSTIHQVKGLEFPYVFVFGLNEGVLPLRGDLEEERRIAYVAFTRAKELLILTANEGYNPILQQQNLVSKFLKEIRSDFLEEDSRRILNLTSTPELTPFDSNKPKFAAAEDNYNDTEQTFCVNDKLIHTFFGEGIVLEVIGDSISVLFKMPHGRKVLNSKHKAIKRIIN